MQGTAGDDGRPEGQGPGRPRAPAACRRSPASSRRPTSSTTASRARTRWAGASSKDFTAPFDFHELDTRTERSSCPSTDEDEGPEIGRQISPINHVTADDPPTLIIHGDADKLVPIQQAEIIVEKLKEAGRRGEARRQAGRRPRLAERWSRTSPRIADWFDRYLKKK